MAKSKMTHEEMKAEIERLQKSPEVIAARKEQREIYKERQRLYSLRWLAKRGAEILSKNSEVN